jgi:hypothetical protein
VDFPLIENLCRQDGVRNWWVHATARCVLVWEDWMAVEQRRRGEGSARLGRFCCGVFEGHDTVKDFIFFDG